MAFVKGQERPRGSGRQKGTPNRKTVAKVSDYLGEQGINPAEEVLKIINEKVPIKNDAGEVIAENFVLQSQARADLWLELLSFCHAKPKTLEIKQFDDNFDAAEFESVATEDLMKVVGNPPTTGTA